MEILRQKNTMNNRLDPNLLTFGDEAAPCAAEVREALLDSLVRTVGKHPQNASSREWFQAVAFFVRGQLADPWLRTKGLCHQRDVKVVYYLSMEFLIGRSLRNHLFNLGLDEACDAALASLGISLDELCELEHEAPLGNGGLGRLAACFLDSLTALGYPACGYGIRYDAGMFSQRIEEGWQVETPDGWPSPGNPWEYPRASVSHVVGFGGRVADRADGTPACWEPAAEVVATAFDLQISGHAQSLANNLRLWSARSADGFDLGQFNAGDHLGAVRERSEAEALSRVLYPDDSTPANRELRLRQEYFFVSASLQDILARFLESGQPLACLPDKVAIQLNDTHPALAIAEMMRLLVDHHGLRWDDAWSVTTEVFAYTNHTLLPEALETWPVALMEQLLPRHIGIIYRINADFLGAVRRRYPHDEALVRRVSLIEEGGERRVRMAHLAIVGSHKINGVSALHTDIMRRTTFSDFDRLYPGRMVCQTNGITIRRWLNQANPELTRLISSAIGEAWVDEPGALSQLGSLGNDPGFRQTFAAVKRTHKAHLAQRIHACTGTLVDPASLFDVHVKRIHEYKRQLLNLLHVVVRYNRIRSGNDDALPRTVIFAGKAASSYLTAKLVIKLVHDVAAVVNNDPATRDLLKVVFMPNYGVTLAEEIIPAAELSEQISTAGSEASGTGNMKLALNGALTIGTRDGANIEIGNAVGAENVFFFGLDADEVAARRRDSAYAPRSIYETRPDLRLALDMIANGYFSPDDVDRFRPLVDSLIDGGDYYMLLADFDAYLACQAQVDALYRSPGAWARKAIVNVAGMGRFSSDYTIRGYAEEIWRLRAIRMAPVQAGAA